MHVVPVAAVAIVQHQLRLEVPGEHREIPDRLQTSLLGLGDALEPLQILAGQGKRFVPDHGFRMREDVRSDGERRARRRGPRQTDPDQAKEVAQVSPGGQGKPPQTVIVQDGRPLRVPSADDRLHDFQTLGVRVPAPVSEDVHARQAVDGDTAEEGSNARREDRKIGRNRVDDVQGRERELVGMAREEVLHALVDGFGIAPNAPDALDRVDDVHDLLVGVSRPPPDQVDGTPGEFARLLDEFRRVTAHAFLDLATEIRVGLQRELEGGRAALEIEPLDLHLAPKEIDDAIPVREMGRILTVLLLDALREGPHDGDQEIADLHGCGQIHVFGHVRHERHVTPLPQIHAKAAKLRALARPALAGEWIDPAALVPVDLRGKVDDGVAPYLLGMEPGDIVPVGRLEGLVLERVVEDSRRLLRRGLRHQGLLLR